MVDAMTRVPGAGSGAPVPTSSTHRLDPRNMTLLGAMVPLVTTRPSRLSTHTPTGCDIVNVWIERVRSNTALWRYRESPSSRSRGVKSTRTNADHPDGSKRTTLRYTGLTGTLVALWQRQNDVNSALAAQRRTTAANQTRAADSARSRHILPQRFVPPSGYTTRRFRFREVRLGLQVQLLAQRGAGRVVR